MIQKPEIDLGKGQISPASNSFIPFWMGLGTLFKLNWLLAETKVVVHWRIG